MFSVEKHNAPQNWHPYTSVLKLKCTLTADINREKPSGSSNSASFSLPEAVPFASQENSLSVLSKSTLCRLLLLQLGCAHPGSLLESL